MVYAKKGKHITLQDILKDFQHPTKGKPTFVAQLGMHLLENKIQNRLVVSISTLVSPAWKNASKEELIENMGKWLSAHPDDLWHEDVEHTLSYLQKGGELIQESYSKETIKEMIDRKSLVLIGVDEDWLWGHRFKLIGDKRVVDDIEGKREGHFVLVDGYNNEYFHVLDPFPTNLEDRHGQYNIPMNQLVNASLTWDGQLLEILA